MGTHYILEHTLVNYRLEQHMFQDPLSSLVMLMEKEKVTAPRDDGVRDFFNKHILPHYDFTKNRTTCCP